MTPDQLTHEGPVTLVVRVAHTVEETVTLHVDKEAGEDDTDLVYRYDGDITSLLPWSDWDLINVEVQT